MTKLSTPRATTFSQNGAAQLQDAKPPLRRLSDAYTLVQAIKAGEGKPSLVPLTYDAIAARGVLAEGIAKPNKDGIITRPAIITGADKSQLHAAICPVTGHGIRHPQPGAKIEILESRPVTSTEGTSN